MRPTFPLFRRLHRPTFTLLTLLSVAACAVSENNPQVFADFDRGTSFDSYRTFAWKSVDPFVVSSTRPLQEDSRALLLKETSAQLEAKGLTQVDLDTNPDLLVSIIVGSRSGLRQNNYPIWGRNYSDVRDTSTGGVGVELFRAGADPEQRLWTGWATTGLTEEVYVHREDVVQQLITLVLDQFPPGG